MARKKAYTDALNNIISFNAFRTRRVDNISQQESNVLNEKELLHQKYYDTDGTLNVKIRTIYGTVALLDGGLALGTEDLNIVGTESGNGLGVTRG
tara:strand:+ start:756 stop:1040 length:285 start_codon:yes stop_codon:yes gene_type:complete